MVLSGEGPLAEQLATALKSDSGRVLDLFRSWDADGDGEVSKKEFHKAIPALGFDVPKSDVEELFNTWDKDGGGSLAYKELKKILAGAPSPGPPKVAKAAAGLKAAGKFAAAAKASGS